MAMTACTSYELQIATGTTQSDGVFSLTGTASLSTNQARTGTRSARVNPASGASGAATHSIASGFGGFGLYIATMPSVARSIVGFATSNAVSIRLNTNGTLSVMTGGSAGTLIGTSATALTTGVWYWISLRRSDGSSVPLLQINGVTEVTGTLSGMGSQGWLLGCNETEASAIDLYFDDLIVDDAAHVPPSKVATLLPISDNSRTNWTAGAGATTNLFDAVDNNPAGGVASASETNTTNIESASNTGTANYVANLATYASAGINAADTVRGVTLFCRNGEDIATGTKTGTFELTGNPVVGTTAFTFGNDNGAHAAENGGAWVTSTASSSSPSVTVGSSPTMRVTKTDTTTRVACVDLMGINVAWTPVDARVPYSTPYPQLLAH